MKCDRKWWLDGRSALRERYRWLPEPGEQFCVPRTRFLAKGDTMYVEQPDGSWRLVDRL
jgi:predicted glycosyl hydrolase (DUF1957 family)